MAIRDQESLWNTSTPLRANCNKSTANTAYILTIGWAPVIPMGSMQLRMDYINPENNDELASYLLCFNVIEAVGKTGASTAACRGRVATAC